MTFCYVGHYGLKPVPYAIRTNDPQSLTGQAGTEQAAPHSLLLASLSLNFLALSLSISSLLPSFQLSQCSHHVSLLHPFFNLVISFLGLLIRLSRVTHPHHVQRIAVACHEANSISTYQIRFLLVSLRKSLLHEQQLAYAYFV